MPDASPTPSAPDSLILGSISDAVVLTDVDGIVTFWNPGAATLFGWTADEMIGRLLVQRVPPEARPRFAALMRDILAGVPFEGEIEDFRKDGTRVWIETRLQVVPDTGGRPLAILGISHDISARRQAEAALQAHAAFERDVLDSMAAHVAVLDATGAIVTVNRAWRAFAADNSRPDQPMASSCDVGASYLRVCHDAAAAGDADARAVAEGIEAVLSGRLARFDREYPCHGPGQPRWFSLQVSPLGQGRGCVVAHVDITQQRLAEGASREHRDRLSLALSAAHMGVWVLDMASERIVWSPEVYEIVGVDSLPDTLEAFKRVVHRDDLPRLLGSFERALRQRTTLGAEFRVLLPGGQIRWLSNLAEFHLDAGGHPISMVGTVHDVSEAKSGERIAERRQRVLQRIATGAELGGVLEDIVHLVEDQLPGSICSVLLLEPDTGRLRIGAGPNLPAEYNAAVDGLTISAVGGSCGTAAWRAETVNVTDIATDPLWEPYRELALPHGLRSCLSVPIFPSARLPAAGARPRVLGTFALYRTTVGEPDPAAYDVLDGATHLAAVAIEREHVLDELREEEERFRVLVDGVRDYALVLLDADGAVRTWNSGAERAFGYSASEAIGQSLEGLTTPDDGTPPGAQGLVARVAATGRDESEGWRLRKDGSRFWATVAATALRRADGTLRGVAVVVRDLTERRRLEEQLRQSQKMDAIGQLAGGVAHDFNNLLTVINGYSEILLMSLPEGGEDHEAAAAIREVGERAAALTSKLLAFSRKAIVEPRVLDLNAVTESTGTMLRRLIGEDVTLVMRFAPHAGGVRMDLGQLEQLLVNLAVNARDAMPSGGELLVQTSAMSSRDPSGAGDPNLPAGRYAVLTVSDTGIGMTEDIKRRIFEPFFTTKSTGYGTGLGLATVYGIVQQAGGHITVESEPGKGATFRVVLPVVAETPAARTPSALHEAPKGTETILLAEDEVQVRRLAQLALERQGYTVLEAGSGTEAAALALAHEGRIDLLLTDVVMPDLGGRALADQVRAGRPGVKVLYISGYTDDAVIRHGVEAAVDHFLQKPFTPLSLARKVRQVLDGSA